MRSYRSELTRWAGCRSRSSRHNISSTQAPWTYDTIHSIYLYAIPNQQWPQQDDQHTRVYSITQNNVTGTTSLWLFKTRPHCSMVQWDCLTLLPLGHARDTHTALHERPLTIDERLNKHRSRHTSWCHPSTVMWTNRRGMSQLRLLGHRRSITFINPRTQNYKWHEEPTNQLTSQMHDDDLRSFLMQNESCPPPPRTFEDIDWNASERALRRLSKNRQMNVIKFCHNYCHTSSRHVKFYGGYPNHAAYVKKPKKTGDTTHS
jgi:hypothetical protein